MATIPEAGSGSSGGPKAAVIIPHYNDTVRLKRCLSALIDGSAPGDLDGVEILVCDNGSSENVPDVLAPWPTVRLVHEAKKGAAHARNRGVAESKAPFLWFLDADCVPAAGWAARAAKPLAADIVGGDVETFDETPAPRSGAEAFETVFAFDQRRYIEDQNFSVTANLLTTRALFERTGPFIDGVPEDKEWCLRAHAAGATIAYDPNLRVKHPSRSDWPALRKKWRRLTDEAWGGQKHSPQSRLAWALRAGLVAVSGLVHLPRLLTSNRLAGPGERMRGGLTLLRLRGLRALWMLGQAIR